jgi:predicted RNA polymerase sigma factor
MHEGLAAQIYRILAAIEVVPEVARHEDPDFWLISNSRCLKLTKKSDKQKVRQFARDLKELDQEQRADEKADSK